MAGPDSSTKEKKAKGSGGLFSITINPYTCKACALCVTVCEDDALSSPTWTSVQFPSTAGRTMAATSDSGMVKTL